MDIDTLSYIDLYIYLSHRSLQTSTYYILDCIMLIHINNLISCNMLLVVYCHLTRISNLECCNIIKLICKNVFYPNIQQIKKKAVMLQTFKKQIHNNQALINNQNFDQIQNLTQVSYCFKCQRIKQPRVHHCKICNKCILRMDHHCPFIGTCVGQYNHKYFIQFLFYSTLGCTIIFLSLMIDFFTTGITKNQPYVFLTVILIIDYISSLCLAIAIGSLFGGQIFMIINNLTTIDTHINSIFIRNPFDRGFRHNLSQICGQSNYFLPTKPFSNCQINISY